MTEWSLSSPVAFIIFNRPDTTERVFREIARAKPPKLLVVADGPRQSHPEEVERCAQTRAIIEQVDWECEVLTNYSDINLGCKNRVASGLDWVFEQVPEAIVLEDDCLPHPTFFRFCQEMLEHYREDERIGMISGDNFQFGAKRTHASYYFSRYNHIWGWASWRRAWQHYRRDAAIWPGAKEKNLLHGVFNQASLRRYWSKKFEQVYQGEIDTWDYQWTLTLWSQGMLTVLPNINLISNIGFGEEATHTRIINIFANMPVEPMEFPLRHPDLFIPDHQADHYTSKKMFCTSPIEWGGQKFQSILMRRRIFG